MTHLTQPSFSSVQAEDPARFETVYLDHNATTPPDPQVLQNLAKWANEDWGNPSSIHSYGRGPKARIREARAELSQALKCSPLELVFTSGGSESNTTGLLLLAERAKQQLGRPGIVAAKIEHPSVLKTLVHLEAQGHPVYWASVDRSGAVSVDDFTRLMSQPNVGVATLMLANNETGVVQPVEELARIAKQRGVLFHTDAVQALGRLPIDFQRLEVESASFAGHKFYALKGAGVLFLRKGNPVRPLIFGGGQERARRGGTENTLAIASLGLMAKRLNRELEFQTQKMRFLRDDFERQVVRSIRGVAINGLNQERLASTSSLLIDEIDGETLLMALDIEGFAVSTGAACSSGSPEPSHVLLAMGLTRAQAQRSLRVGLGWSTTQDEIERFVHALARTVERLRTVRKSSQRSIQDLTVLEGAL